LYSVALGHPVAPISIQGIRKNAHILAFQQPVRCPRFKTACRKLCLSGKIKALHIFCGRHVAIPGVTWPDASYPSGHALL
jgi:hypothetical protein